MKHKIIFSLAGIVAFISFFPGQGTILAQQNTDFSLINLSHVFEAGMAFSFQDGTTITSSKPIIMYAHSSKAFLFFANQPSSVATTTLITISGLNPLTQYFKYQDSNSNKSIIQANQAGTITFEEDITVAHDIWFQPHSGTVFINSSTTLTGDLGGGVEINASNITLDCNDHFIIGSAILMTVNGKSNVTIKNCHFSDGELGLVITGGNNMTIQNNSFSFLHSAITAFNISNSNISNNQIVQNFRTGGGIQVLFGGGGNIVNSNKIIGSFTAMAVSESGDSITNNNLTNAFQGILSGADNLIMGNTISDMVGFGLILFGGGTVFHNNIFGNDLNVFSFSPTELSSGGEGNFWGHTQQPCFHVFGGSVTPLDSNRADTVDSHPFCELNGWLKQKINVSLSWSKNQDTDFESYRIFRSTQPGVSATSTLAKTITDQNQTTFLDKDLDPKNIYFYRIFVFDRAGLSSGSNETSTTP